MRVRDLGKLGEIVSVTVAEAHPRNGDDASLRRDHPAQNVGGHAFARRVDERRHDALLAQRDPGERVRAELVGVEDDLVAGFPIQSARDDVRPVAGVPQEGDLLGRRPDEASDALANLRVTDVGHRLVATVKATNGEGTAEANSAPSAVPSVCEKVIVAQ